MNKIVFALLFMLSVSAPLLAQQSENRSPGNSNAVAAIVDAVQAPNSASSSSCYGADLIQSRKRVPVDTSQRLANPGNGEPDQLKKRVPVDTSQRLVNPSNGEPDQLKKRMPVDTSQRLVNPGNGEPDQLKKRMPIDTSQRVGNFETTITVYPNPASGTLYLRQLPDQTLVRLYSSTGQLVVEERGTGSALDIQLNSLAEGVYLLQFPELNKVVRIVHAF